MKQYVSYSELSAYYWDKQRWYDRYILGKEEEMPERATLGSDIHKYWEDEKYPLTEKLKERGYTPKQVVAIKKAANKLVKWKLPEPEAKMYAELKNEIKLFGLFDSWDKENKILAELKTSDQEDAWTQWRVNNNEQLSFYALIYWKTYHGFLKEIRLHFLNPKKGTLKTFYTARGPKDLEHIYNKIQQFVQDIKNKGLWSQRLSREERDQLQQKKLKL